MQENDTDAVIFCGVDEVTEIAYLSLQEAGLALSAVVDTKTDCVNFLGRKVQTLDAWQMVNDQPIVLTSLKNSESLRHGLLERGVAEERIFSPIGNR